MTFADFAEGFGAAVVLYLSNFWWLVGPTTILVIFLAIKGRS